MNINLYYTAALTYLVIDFIIAGLLYHSLRKQRYVNPIYMMVRLIFLTFYVGILISANIAFYGTFNLSCRFNAIDIYVLMAIIVSTGYVIMVRWFIYFLLFCVYYPYKYREYKGSEKSNIEVQYTSYFEFVDKAFKRTAGVRSAIQGNHHFLFCKSC
jgi:hypothetical protein